jgi:hypothetical protein
MNIHRRPRTEEALRIWFAGIANTDAVIPQSI